MSEKSEEKALRDALADAIEGVGKDSAEAISALRRRSRRMRTLLACTAGAVALSLGSVGVAIATLSDLQSNQTAIERATKRTSDDVLCPLYEVFLASDTPAAREQVRKTQGADAVAARDEAFKVIRDGYGKLECNR